MSHWNYRIGLKRSIVNGEEVLEYGLTEAYYNDKGDLWLTTERFMKPSGETKEELIENLETMLNDAKKDVPVLDLDKLWKELEMKENVENKL